jgi:DNA-directed RNA polymerase subunit H
MLVPKHEIATKEEEEGIMKKYHIASKSKFPLIRYHVDPIIRLIGAIPGNIIKITRPSESAGETIYYRCVSV